MIIIYLNNFTTINLFLTLKKYTTDPTILLPLYILSFSSISLLTTYLIKISLKKFKKSYLSLNKTYIIIISFILFTTFTFFYIYSTNTNSNNNNLIPYTLIFIKLIIFISIIILIISLFTLKKIKYKQNQKKIKTYYKYTLKIKTINNKIHKFQHNYINILTTLSKYIHKNNIINLHTYFNKNIIPIKNNLQINTIKLNNIKNLKIHKIKNLITTKILHTQKINIPINIKIPNKINNINLNMINLNHNINIILNNTIKTSTKINNPIIHITFIKNKNSITFIIINKYTNNIPHIHKLFQKNFSTKNKNHNLNLSTLKKITNNTNNILLNTIIKNNFFIQKIKIINN